MEFDQEHARHLTELQARMNRMETMMQQLLTILSTSHDSMGQNTQLRTLLAGLQTSPDVQARGMAAGPAGAYPQQQERPEMAAIRQAMLAGNKMRAIQLYRSLYGVDLKTAMTAVESL